MTDDEKYAPIIPIKPYDPNHVPTRSRKFFSFGPAALGIAILVGGSDRFSSPGFDIPSDLAPWWVWGVVFVVLTLIMAPYAFWGSNRVFWPAFLCSAVFLFWAICLGLSALETDTGAFTGFCFYGWYGVCVAGIASRDDHRPLWRKR